MSLGLKRRWSKWRMAENHPVVCALSTTGALCVLTPGGYKEMPAVNAQRILQVFFWSANQ